MKKLVTFLCSIIPFICFAQIPVNIPVDPEDTELTNAVKFITTYFGEFAKGEPDYSKYWGAAACKAYKRPDRQAFGINNNMATYKMWQPTILYTKPENGYVHIKTMFSIEDTSGVVHVIAITNHYIQRDENGKLYFIDPAQLETKNWKTEHMGTITYYYPAYHHFDKAKAQLLTSRIASLQKEWGLPAIPIRYYFTDTWQELEHLRGFDYTLSVGNREKPSGMSDTVNNIVYCGGWGENYFHEIVHIYLDRTFPKSPMQEGLAVFYGGSMGHELSWHVKRLNAYLQQHKEIDLGNLETFYYMDNYTNPYTTILGMLCRDVYNKKGITALRHMMSYTSLDDVFSREYGISKDGWNTFLRKMISNTSKEK